MFRCAVAVMLSGCWLASGVLAQEPTTAPTSAPASQEVVVADSSTPKGTLKLLSQATESGDTAQVRDLMVADTPQEQKLAEVLMERTAIYAKFRQAAAKAFGDAAADQLTGHSPAEAAAAEQRIVQADVKMEGDKASLEMEGQPVNLVRVDGKWKLSMGNLTSGMEAGDVDQRMQQIKMLSEVVVQTTDELNQGKYKTADEVNDAIRSKLASAMLKTAESATQPATAPTTQEK